MNRSLKYPHPPHPPPPQGPHPHPPALGVGGVGWVGVFEAPVNRKLSMYIYIYIYIYIGYSRVGFRHAFVMLLGLVPASPRHLPPNPTPNMVHKLIEARLPETLPEEKQHLGKRWMPPFSDYDHIKRTIQCIDFRPKRYLLICSLYVNNICL